MNKVKRRLKNVFGVSVRRVYGLALYGALGIAMSSCYIDELTAPPADESAIAFSVSGDSTLLLGDSLQLSSSFDVGAGTGATRITWVSEDTTVARVDDVDGIVYGVGAGTTQISAYLVAPDLDNDLLRTLPMEVRYAGIGMVNDSLTGLGESRTLEARGLDVLGGMHEVVPAVFWSPDDSIVSLDSAGVVVAKRNGTATITASWDDFTTQAPILVRQVAGRIIFNVPELKFPVLQTDTTLTVDVRDTQDSVIISPQVTWSSSNTTVISATATGVIRALQRGASTITVRSDTASATLPVGVAQVVTSLTINAGADQSAQVDTPVAVAPAVVARDASGNPVEGALVTFVAEGGGGRLVDSLRLTDVQGVARVGSWVLGRVVGTNTLKATADSISVAWQATGTPGPASAATSSVTAVADTIPAGTNATLTLQAVDAFGNPVVTGGNTVAFAASGGTSTGALGVVTDNDDGTYTAMFAGETAGTATTIDATLDGVAVTTPSPTVTVVPGSVAQMSRDAGEGQTAAIGSPVFVQPAVLVMDAFSNPVPGADVTFSVTAGGGSVVGASAVSNASGIATVTSWTLGGTPGVNTLTASATDASPVVFNANAVTGAASELTSLITTSIDTILAGAVATITLQSKDALNNDLTVGGFTVEFTTVGGTSTGVLSPTTDNGDGTYTATFSGQLAGTATTIGATINGATVTTTLPTITVWPGAVSTVTSLVTASVGNLVAGTNAILTLDTKDAFGNDIPTGGHAVVFNIAGGTSTGTIGATTDVGDGTYTATLTGQLAGTPVTVGATIDGAAVTSTLPTLTVIPGAVSTATSLVTSSVATLVAGSNAVLTLVAKDALGNNLTTGGHSVVFSIAGGTSTGTVGATVDNGDGTYSSTLTGQLVGTAVTVNATIDGNAVSSTLPSVTIIPAAASPLTSLLTISTDTIAADGLVSLGLDTKDAFGNDVTAGGHAVVFTASGGTSTGSISATSDNGDGSYSATFAGLLAGTATSIGATIDGQAVATALPTITVIPGLPVNVAVNAGDNQFALFGTAVAVAPSVIVTDNQGNPVGGVAVTFTVTAGLGVVLPLTPVNTGVDGVASATSWSVGGVIPGNQLTATASGVGSVVFNATAVTGLPIIFEETVTGTANASQATLPEIAGGTNQTYVLFGASPKNFDITGVTGGGLVWTEQIEQCGGATYNYNRIWTAQGSPAGTFQVVVQGNQPRKVAYALVRYSNVAAVEGPVGNNNNNGICSGNPEWSTTVDLSLTSTVDGSVHLVGVALLNVIATGATAGYATIAAPNLDNTNLYVYGREFTSATTDVLNVNMSGPDHWSAAGVVLRPN